MGKKRKINREGEERKEAKKDRKKTSEKWYMNGRKEKP
jgi:hypothetical protein